MYGAPIDCSEDGLELAYNRIALSIAEYEGSNEVNQLSSKYDAYLDGKAQLTKQEEWGLDLFNRDVGCAGCHPSERGTDGEPPLFTDFTFDNLGVLRNPENPWYDMDEVYLEDGAAINPDGAEWVDFGLGGFLANSDNEDWREIAEKNIGKHKVPTLRNVAKAPGNHIP